MSINGITTKVIKKKEIHSIYDLSEKTIKQALEALALATEQINEQLVIVNTQIETILNVDRAQDIQINNLSERISDVDLKTTNKLVEYKSLLDNYQVELSTLKSLIESNKIELDAKLTGAIAHIEEEIAEMQLRLIANTYVTLIYPQELALEGKSLSYNTTTNTMDLLDLGELPSKTMLRILYSFEEAIPVYLIFDKVAGSTEETKHKVLYLKLDNINIDKCVSVNDTKPNIKQFFMAASYQYPKMNLVDGEYVLDYTTPDTKTAYVVGVAEVDARTLNFDPIDYYNSYRP